MNMSIVVQNPVVVGMTVFAGLVLAFTIFRSWLRGRWERAENPIYRIEPDIDRRPVPAAAYADDPGIGSGPRPETRKRRGGRPLVAFALGVLFGLVVLPEALREGTGPLANALTGIQASLAEAIDAVDPTLVGSVGGRPDAPDRLVVAMRKDLPKKVDDRTTLVSIEGDKSVLTLAHRVSGPIQDDQAAAFAEATKDRIVSGTCGATPVSEARLLNDEGVELRYVYADAGGRTIAAITLEPDFCARSR